MNTRNKIILGLVAVGTFSGIALAQPGMMGCDGPGMMQGRGGMRGMKAADPAARVDQHLTQFKSELKLTAEQEPLWQAFAEKAKAEAGKGYAAMRDVPKDVTAPERMDRMTQLMKERLAAMESVSESFKRLYAGLTAEQKKTADLYAGYMGHMGPKGAMGPRGRMGGPAGTPPAPRN